MEGSANALKKRRGGPSIRRRAEYFRAFETWGFDEHGWSKQTRYQYRRRAEAADEWLRYQRDSSIFYASLDDLKAYLFQTEPSIANRNHIRLGLVAFGEYLVELGFWKENVAIHLPRLQEPKRVGRVPTDEEMAMFLKAVEGAHLREQLAVALLLYQGMRLLEVTRLRWGEIEGDWLRFIGKGNKQRESPLHSVTKELLSAWRVRCPDAEWVFPSPRKPGHPLAKRSVSSWIKQIADAAGVPWMHPHALRHAFATKHIERNVNPRVVQELMGHASLSSTQRYTHIRSKQTRAAQDQLSFDEVR